MSDQAGLINEKRSANREQQTLPGGLRTPAEKDVLFCKDQVAYDAVSGETWGRCYWCRWVLGNAQLQAGLRSELLRWSHREGTVPSQSYRHVTGLSAEPCECNSLEHAARSGERPSKKCTSKVDPPLPFRTI